MRRAVAVVAVALMLVGGLSACNKKKSSAPPPPQPTATISGTPLPRPSAYTSPPANLPVAPIALSTSPPPWLPPAVINNGQDSATYVLAAGLPYAEEMLSVHYHAHLDIVADGKKVSVPPYIGFVTNGTKISGLAPLHTHQDDGIIHIENDRQATFLLGQFFVEWGVRLTKQCIGGLCAGNGKQLAFYVDGQPYTGDPRRIVLRKHEEIAIEYGATGSLPSPPSSYNFPSGL